MAFAYKKVNKLLADFSAFHEDLFSFFHEKLDDFSDIHPFFDIGQNFNSI